MDIVILWKLLAVLLLVAANAYFVAAEFALVSARRTRISEMVREGDRLARAVEVAQRDLDRSVSGCQLGITLASLGLGWIGEPALAQTLEGAFARLPGFLAPVATHATAVAIAFALLTYLHIVLGEQAPKMAAILRAESMSRWLAGPLNLFNWVVAPAIWVINSSSNLLLRPFGIQGVKAHERVHSPREIQMLLQHSLREGVVEEDEQAMIHGVFELTHTVAREVMTPRTDIVAVPAASSLEEMLAVVAESGFSRFPVYGESLDDIVGVILVKDLIAHLAREDGGATARALAREALFIPDTKPVDDLLAELRHEKVHMAIVVDEFGGTDGIVTLEDLVEEIVGDIYDEHDVEHPELVVAADGSVFVDGGYAFDDLIAEFDLRVPEEDEYDTVAGFVIGHLGRIPDEGERVPLGQGELEVVGLQDRRVTRLVLHRTPASGEAGVEMAPEEEGVPDV